MIVLKSLDRLLGGALRWIAILGLVALFVLLFANVIVRTFQIASVAWFDEVVQWLFAWTVFAGAAALWREGEHFKVDILESLLADGRAARFVHKILIELLCLFFLVVMTWKGWELTMRNTALTPILQMPAMLPYAAMPVSGAIMCLYSLADIVAETRRAFTPKPKPDQGAVDDL